MDDPWGSSPWADELQEQQPVKTKKDDVGTKPSAPVRASTLALEEKTNSPWNDVSDDGFGEWAALPMDDTGGLGLDAADDDWEQNTGDNRELPNVESSALSAPWNESPSNSNENIPKLSPVVLPKPAEIARQPSPDPWATETTSNNAAPKGDGTSADLGKLKEIHQEVISDGILEERYPEDSAPAPTDEELVPGTVGNTSEILPVSKESSERETGDSIEQLEDPTLAPVSAQTSEVHEIDPVSSRPSSSPSERSHHDEVLQDSPRTSIDEDPKRPQMPRKASSKVQELVQHFDGLAKPEVEPIGNRPISAQSANIDEEVENDMDDFGDFEEGQSEIGDSITEDETQVSAKCAPGQETESAETTTGNQDIPISSPPSRKDYGPVEFVVDASLLEKLYTGVEPDASHEKLFIPDTVPHDSFVSTEERKTWYRISRYGTMRKYNTGNDENYVRVTWPTSKVRDETLKIVSRWMEEDRISGRVVLGGGKGSSIFGWNDPKAPAVPLSHAFAAKRGKSIPEAATSEPVSEIPREWPKGLVKTRPKSKSRSPSQASRRSSMKSAQPIAEVKTGEQTPVANFGWNAGTDDVLKSKSDSPKPGKKLSGSVSLTASPVSKSDLSQSSLPSNQLPPTAAILNSAGPSKSVTSINQNVHPISAVQSAAPVLPSLSTSNLHTDDDDWGELVSSPATTLPPVLQPSNSLGHKKSQSLGGSFSAVPHISSPLARDPVLPNQSGQSHRSNPSFDQILTPQTATSTTMTHLNGAFGFGSYATTPIPASSKQNIIGTNPTSSVQNNDPWASADFSFFDAPSASQPKSVTAPALKPMPAKSVSFGTPTSTTSLPRHEQRSREEIEQDRIVQSVVKSLPDLSYMLRR
jgi:hypothetical protein